MNVGVSATSKDPPLEIRVGRLLRKVQTLVVKFCGLVAHKEGSNSGLVFGSTSWAPISSTIGFPRFRSARHSLRSELAVFF